MRVTTLGEQGPNLPFGFEVEGKLVKDLSFRRYGGRVDRALGGWVSGPGQEFQGRELMNLKVGRLTGLLTKQMGPHELLLARNEDGIEDVSEETLLILHQAHMADVLYAHVYARRQTLGNEYKMPVLCPHCKFDGTGDNAPVFLLDSLEVHCVDSPEELYCWFEIEDPFPLRGGGECHSVQLKPLPWRMMKDPSMSISAVSGTFGLYAAEHSIVAVNGDPKPYRITSSELDEIGKRDLIRLERAVGQWRGINPQLKVDCPGQTEDGKTCGKPLFDLLDWSVENFFGDSLVTSDI